MKLRSATLFFLTAFLLGPVGSGMAQAFLSRKKPTPPARPTSRWQNLDDYLNPTDTLRLALIYEPTKQADTVAATIVVPVTPIPDTLPKLTPAIADSAGSKTTDSQSVMDTRQTIYQYSNRPALVRTLPVANQSVPLATPPAPVVDVPVSELERVLNRKKQAH